MGIVGGRAAHRVRQSRQPLARPRSRREAARNGDQAGGRGDPLARPSALLVESVFLSLLGGIAGLALSCGAPSPARLLREAVPDLTVSACPDSRILGFVLLLSFATGLLFGMIPALQSIRPALAPTLKNEAGVLVGGSSCGCARPSSSHSGPLAPAADWRRPCRAACTIDDDRPGVQYQPWLHSASTRDERLRGCTGQAVCGRRCSSRFSECPEVTGAGFGSASLLEGG